MLKLKLKKHKFLFFIILFFSFLLFSVLLPGESKPEKKKYVITGDRMEVKEKGKVISFLGNVKMIHENIEIISKKMESVESEGKIYGEGDVKLSTVLENGEKLKINSNNVIYDKNTKYVIFTSSPVLTKYLEGITTSYLVLSSEKLEFWSDEKKAKSSQNTKIVYQDFELYSIDSIYDDNKKNFQLFKNVRIFENAVDYKGRYTADNAIYYIDEGRAEMDGNVKAEIERKDLKNN